MKIGINLLAVYPSVSGGMEYYLKNLLENIFKIDRSNQYVIFTNREYYSTFEYMWPNVEIVSCGISSRPQWKRVVWEQLILPSLATKYRLDLLHSPTYTWPVRAKVRGVVSILDMLYRVHPDSIPPIKLAFWRIFVPWSASRCRKILTISESSKSDIVRYLKVPPEKVTVTPLALDRILDVASQPTQKEIEGVCVKYQIRKPYLLYVGGVGKHKNPLVLVKSLAIIRTRTMTKEMTLVITGNNYGSADEILSNAVSADLEGVVRLPGYVTRSELPAIYAGAFAYVSPSLFEGFGLTLLESMAFGTPVITSDRSSLPEVAGDAALIVDPEQPGLIADAVSRIACEPGLREELIRRGLKRVQEFSWERTARLTLDAYETVNARK